MKDPLPPILKPEFNTEQQYTPPIDALFTALRDRLKMRDDQNHHDTIALDLLTSAPGYMICHFDSPIDSKPYKMIISEYEEESDDEI
jgi:hypothetical protein